MNILTQEAKKKQAIVEYAKKNGKSKASRKYGVSLSSVKRWCNRYDGTWQSLVERSHRPHSNPNRHTKSEERKIKKAFSKCYARYGRYGVYEELRKKHYTRSFSGMVYAAKKMGLTEKPTENKPPRTPWHNGKVERSHRNDQRYFYDWETFGSVEELNEKLAKHLIWSNNRAMRTLGWKSPIQLLAEKAVA